jgi:penicillin V acylase-like amidase (Ntn superfamily)
MKSILSAGTGLCTAIVVASLFSAARTNACTRAVYLGPGNMVVDGRSMDWMEDPGTDLYLFPRGMQRDGATGTNTVKWTSKYGSVIANFYGIATVDGINEKGLAANVLYLGSSDYGKPDARPTISIAAWSQYVLDNFATVNEVVSALEKESFTIIAPVLPNGSPAVGHLAVSDPSGDSAIFEYIDGKLVIHHGRQFQVMTNEPTFDKQLALTEYWQQIGGMTMLPGTIRPADRFVRASFFIGAVKQSADPREAVAACLSVIRNASVPWGLSSPSEPNVASTVWLTVSDQKNLVYYYQHALSAGALWVDLNALDLAESSGVRKLPLAKRYDIEGDATGRFEPAEAFEFLGASEK